MAARVLVVDDEVDFANAPATRLTRRGYVASAAFSGPEAQARLRRDAADVVILDLKMEAWTARKGYPRSGASTRESVFSS